jgi:predicted component of type VI protein secretion system
MPAQLVSLNEGPSILLDKPILLIGRHPECDIQIDSRKVSRRHCCIAQVSDYLVVRDLGSTNGIRINGVRVLEGRLKASDELTIGGNRYQVSWEVLPPSSIRSAQSARNKPEAERPLRPVAPDEDELLEACDEPIPLSEPVAPPPGRMARPDLPTAGYTQAKSHVPDPSLPLSERNISHIIPEELKLAPGSDLNLHDRHPST